MTIQPELLEILTTSISHFYQYQASHDAVQPQRITPIGSEIVTTVALQQAQELDRFKELWAIYLSRLESNYPFAHPSYAGQMLKPPHPVAWLAYTMAMLVNGNNHALDGGPDTSAMEKEVIAQLTSFFEFPEQGLGHLTASGTIANLEALWIARCLHPQKAIAFTRQAHYTHARMCEVLGIRTIILEEGMEEQQLQAFADQIGTLVVTMGTTGIGKVEPLHQWLPLCHSLGIRVHIDAAYGGFFKSLVGSGLVDDDPWALTGMADSLVVDPHKHGLQPYGCGCVLFRDPEIGHFYKHDSPYTYFTSDELHLGEISLECSRPGAAAAALWLTLSMYPLTSADGLTGILKACKTAANTFSDHLLQGPDWDVLTPPELDIVCYFPTQGIRSFSQLHETCTNIMKSAMQGDPSQRAYVSLYAVPVEGLTKRYPEWECDVDRVVVLRSVFMKPEHQVFIPELIRRLTYHRAVLKGI